MTEQRPLAQIRDLHVSFRGPAGLLPALRGVNLRVQRREVVGLVGESGCGKSLTGRALLNMVPPPGFIERGTITFRPPGGTDPVDITAADPKGATMRALRGDEIALVFQEPMSALSPVHTVGQQIVEAIRIHRELDARASRARAIDLLGRVGIPDPYRRVDAYPFQLSGGMRQRAMIALALACEPSLLIADEPTTALDVTLQAQILRLLQELRQERDMAILMITHNFGVVAALADRVAVMYLGRIIESGTVQQVFADPLHPYTHGLMRSVPRLGEDLGKRLWAIQGSVPDATARIPGCTFHPRCESFMPGVCDVAVPPISRTPDGHEVACFLYPPTPDHAVYAPPPAATGAASSSTPEPRL